jgi:hypothetical protein
VKDCFELQKKGASAAASTYVNHATVMASVGAAATAKK